MREIDDFYKFVTRYQPTNRTPASIDGKATNNLTTQQLSKLRGYGVPFVRAARHNNYVNTTPKLKLVIPQDVRRAGGIATWIRTKPHLTHYFTHINQVLHLAELNNNAR